MDGPSTGARGARLSRAWRRALVSALWGSGVGTVALELTAGDLPPLLHGGHLFFAAIAVGCLWLLADTLRPWLGLGDVSAEERARADAAVRRSYGALFWVALGMICYLQIGDDPLGAAEGAGVRPMQLLHLLVALLMLFPLTLAAWDDVAPESELEPLSPWSLTLARLTGPSATTYGAGLGVFAVAVALLLLLGTTPESRTLLELASIAALLIVGALILLSLRTLHSRADRSR